MLMLSRPGVDMGYIRIAFIQGADLPEKNMEVGPPDVKEQPNERDVIVCRAVRKDHKSCKAHTPRQDIHAVLDGLDCPVVSLLIRWCAGAHFSP